MRKATFRPKNIAVSHHPGIDQSFQDLVHEVIEFIDSQEVESTYYKSIYDEKIKEQLADQNHDCLIAIGGDGTLLRAGQLCAPWKVPILGINRGKFGFLTEVRDGNWKDAIRKTLQGDFHFEDRIMVHAELWRGDKLIGSWDSLNEVVVCRGFLVRPVHLTATVDGFPLASFVADGLILSTPTGSTAYSLAVGGPILSPEMKNFVLIPIAPHLSVDRAVVLPHEVKVEIAAYSEHEVVISIDGQKPIVIENDDVLKAGPSENMVSFIRFQDPGYFYRNITNYMEQNPSSGKIQ